MVYIVNRLAVPPFHPQVIGGLTVALHWRSRMLTAAVKPAYVLLNNLSFPLQVWPCIIDGRPKNLGSAVATTTAIEIHPGCSTGIVLWQRLCSLDHAPQSGHAPQSDHTPQSGHAPSRGGIHALFLRAVGATRWSLPITVGYVRHSFSLPCAEGTSEGFHAALLTTHEHDDITYLVATGDVAPRLRLHNLCSASLEVVEAGTRGLHAAAQEMPPGAETVYEPPTLARLYPMVHDKAVAKEGETALLEAAEHVLLKLRSGRAGDDDEGESERDWSEPFRLESDHDRVIAVPGVGGVLLSSHLRGNTLDISVLPTADVSPVSCSSRLVDSAPSFVGSVSIECTCEQLAVSLDDEVSHPSSIEEMIRLVYDDSTLSFSKSYREGARLEFTVRSSQVDNKMEDSAGEFAVVFIPRAEHAAQPQLVKSTPPPLFRLLIQFDAHTPNLINELSVSVQSFTVQLEDTLLHHLRDLIHTFQVAGTLSDKLKELRSMRQPPPLPGVLVVPDVVRNEARRDMLPLSITRLSVEPIACYINAQISLKVLLSCRETPLHFARYQLCGIYSNWAEVSQTLTAHYFSAVVMRLGWMLGSLDLIGNPGALIQSLGRGLRDLVALPYEGLTRSPGLFIVGLGQGTAAFVRHFSTGALGSVTNMASSLARNLERLSLDPDHVSYQDRQRRESPVTHFTSGLTSGISSFGMSMVSAVAGIVDQPIQSFLRVDESMSAVGATTSVLAGVGKGLIGAVAKPVGGAMAFVSQTGQGIMHGTGLACLLSHRTVELEAFTGPILRTGLAVTATRCTE